jgi:hypothetical protein
VRVCCCCRCCCCRRCLPAKMQGDSSCSRLLPTNIKDQISTICRKSRSRFSSPCTPRDEVETYSSSSRQERGAGAPRRSASAHSTSAHSHADAVIPRGEAITTNSRIFPTITERMPRYQRAPAEVFQVHTGWLFHLVPVR